MGDEISNYLQAFYNSQSTFLLEARIGQMRELLRCLKVMLDEGVIDYEGYTLLSSLTSHRIRLMSDIVDARKM